MDMDRNIGRMLDNRYEILERIGAGGMAVVYKARCHRLNRLVAIKILKDENLQDADFRRRFHAEGQAVAMLSHPNIVSVYDVSTTGDEDYIVMELIDGITLKKYMEMKGVLNWKETLHFATQIAKALEHAHSRGLVHRDIKPHNVMVLKNGSVKVADFGIAHVVSKSNTMTKEALGSVHYISPEQAVGGQVDSRSDLYSLGVVMYEMMTGRPPYDGESPVSIAVQHLAGGAVPPSKLNPNIPRGLEQIIEKAMARDLKDRYASAAAMLADMDAFRKDPNVVFPVAVPKEPQKPAPRPEEKTAVVPQNKTPRRPPQKKPAPKQPRDPVEAQIARSRTATAVIAVCCVAVVVAIVVLLVVLFGSALRNETRMVEVPDLLGKGMDSLPDYDGIQVVQQGTAYSDQYAAGEIVDQLPKAGVQVEAGRTVFVTVSLGPKPPDVRMPDLTGQDEQGAYTGLQGLSLSVSVEVKKEYNDTVQEGLVIRTEPTQGEVLRKGQKITLVISLGREVILAEMPDLLRGNGMDRSEAETRMNLRGFVNLEWVEVDSPLPKGRVLTQSVPAGEMVDVTTHIVITYSSGKEPEKQPVTISYTFTDLPLREEAYFLSIMRGDTVIVMDRRIEAGETTFEISLTGKGQQEYVLYVDGGYYATVTVDFETDV